MINIRSEKHYDKVWSLVERIIALQDSKQLDYDDYEWCEKTRHELYESISIYNNYTNEYKGGHSYGIKKD